MRDMEPDFWRNLREELAAGRHWVDRSVVLGYAAQLMLAWTPALTVALLWWTRRFAPGAMGSGIATGHGRLPGHHHQGPITAFTIVMAMVSGHAMVLSLMACALLASGTARLVTRPMYLELAALLLPVSAPPAASAAGEGRSP